MISHFADIARVQKDAIDVHHATKQRVNIMTRPLYEIAREIRTNWRPVYFGAVPYLAAMGQMDKVTENYGDDTGKSVVVYFLANAQGWRGETARRVKMELRLMIAQSSELRRLLRSLGVEPDKAHDPQLLSCWYVEEKKP